MGDHNFNMSGGRFCFALLSLGILLLLGSAKVKAENRTEPTDNVNMSPNQIWRSTYFCLYYKPLSWCGPESHKLTINGTLNVTDTEVGDFCDRGCANQTRRMLDCLYAVNRHFWFINNATVKVINNTINYACDTKTAFNTTSYERSSAIKVGQKLYVPLISTLVFIAMFKM